MFVKPFIKKNHKKFGVIFLAKPKSGVIGFLRLDNLVAGRNRLSKTTAVIAG